MRSRPPTKRADGRREGGAAGAEPVSGQHGLAPPDRGHVGQHGAERRRQRRAKAARRGAGGGRPRKKLRVPTGGKTKGTRKGRGGAGGNQMTHSACQTAERREGATRGDKGEESEKRRRMRKPADRPARTALRPAGGQSIGGPGWRRKARAAGLNANLTRGCSTGARATGQHRRCGAQCRRERRRRGRGGGRNGGVATAETRCRGCRAQGADRGTGPHAGTGRRTPGQRRRRNQRHPDGAQRGNGRGTEPQGAARSKRARSRAERSRAGSRIAERGQRHRGVGWPRQGQ